MKILRCLLVTLLAFIVAAPVPGNAQSPPEPGAWSRPSPDTGPDFEVWESVASRAEEAIDAGEDENTVFETLRNRIVGFRSQFDAARKAHGERIATLRNQIEALGPAPPDGETEAADISQRRNELDRQLTELLGKVQAAEEAFTRADGLIRQIDSIIRERQTQRLLSLGPSPLNPVHWPAAVEEALTALQDIWTERRILRDEALLRNARDNAPLAIAYLLLGIILLTRGRAWAMILGNRLRAIGGRGTGVWGFVISLLRIALPLGGLFALTEAVYATGLVGVRGGAILNAVPVWGTFLLGFRWLSERLFSRVDEEAVFSMSPGRRSWARFYVSIMALLIVIRGAVELFYTFADFTRASEAVMAFPLVVMLSFVLYRIGSLLRTYTPRDQVDELEVQSVGHGIARVVRWAGLLAQLVSIVAPVMSAVGYAAFGNAILYPMIMSMALLGFVMTLQRFASDIYGWVSGQGSAARDSLLAVLIGLILVICAGPLLALIWGARIADLTELWAEFLRGFQIGDARISPTDFIAFAAIFAIGYILTRLLQAVLRNSVLPKTRIDVGGRNAIVSGLGYVGMFLAALIAITAAGIDLSVLGYVAGALSLGIGFGLQNIVSNFVSGIILLIERPISEGDWIEVGGQHGYVRAISVRSTRIETFDRSDVIVPNSDLVSGTVTNYTRGKTVGRVIVPVGVAYGTDTRKVEKILSEIARGHPMVLMNPEPFVLFQGFADSALNFEIRAILRDVNWVLNVKSDMNHQIAERFAAAGIEIPFPQRELWFRNPETLNLSADYSGAAPIVRTSKPEADVDE